MCTATQETTPLMGGVEATVVTATGLDHRFSGSSGRRPLNGGEGGWTIYVIRDKASGRPYVGVTCRSLEQRSRAHVSQARRGKKLCQGGLLERLRDGGITVKSFHEHFLVEVLATALTRVDAKAKEAFWIAKLRSMAPDGYNLMPGGASLGGPANSVPLSVQVGNVRTEYTSIGAALSARNRTIVTRGGAALLQSTVHARLVSGWSAEQALGYVPHQDGRGLRGQFFLNGSAYCSLNDASTASGIGIATLRSRLHRARLVAESEIPVEIGDDRRSASVGRRPQLGLRHPATGSPVSAREYAKAVGLPVSTVLHRAHRLGIHASAEDMAQPLERRKMVTYVDASGATFTGGYREIVRRVLGSGQQPVPGTRTLSASAIRARLRRLTDVERSNPLFVRWACGQCTGDPTYDDVVTLSRRRIQRHHMVRAGQDRASLALRRK